MNKVINGRYYNASIVIRSDEPEQVNQGFKHIEAMSSYLSSQKIRMLAARLRIFARRVFKCFGI